MYGAAPCVRVVDDDAAVLKSLDRLLRAAGFAVRTFPSSNEFLQQHDGDAPGCVVLDLSMPGLNGLQLQQALARFEAPCPVIFITGYGDVPASVRAMKAGAIDFLLKPFDQAQLLNAVRTAIEKDRSARAARAERELRSFSIAVRTASSSCDWSKGLSRKSTAPAFIACTLAGTSP